MERRDIHFLDFQGPALSALSSPSLRTIKPKISHMLNMAFSLPTPGVPPKMGYLLTAAAEGCERDPQGIEAKQRQGGPWR